MPTPIPCMFMWVALDRSNADSARHIIARLDGSIAANRVPEVAAQLETLKQEMRNLIGTRQTALPLPPVTP